MNDITMRRAIKWDAFTATDVGCVREVNEDSLLSRSEVGLWAVADGMGGYEAGEIASAMVVDCLAEIENVDYFTDFVDLVENKLIEANTNIYEYAEIMCNRRMMGTTIVSLIIKGRIGACLWAGDSRLYRYRNNELQQLSQDHSQVEELIQQGFLERENAASHPEANVITRAIGACEDVFISLNVFSTQIGDTYLLCSDGLHNSVDKEKIVQALDKTDLESASEDLLSQAIDNNVADNVSLIIIRGTVERPAVNSDDNHRKEVV